MGPKRMIKKSKHALTAIKLSIKRQGFGLSVLSTTGRFLQFSRQFGYEPIELFRLGFFDPQFDIIQMDAFLSRKQTTRMQESLNPPTLAGLFKNKVVFYQQCCNHNLPVPQLYGVFSALGKTIHICHNGNLAVLNDKEALAEAMPQRFAIKPVVGSLGDGFKIITRLRDGYKDHNDIFYTPSRFLRLLAKSSPVGTLMQEVIENHPDITSFSGVSGLQTVRITTLVSTDGCVEILPALFKTITETNIVIDTHIENLKGNLEVLVNLSDGSLCQASYLDGAGKGIVVMDNHPVSGNSFKGFVIPYWIQVLELAKQAALMALPVRTIGWDIAITVQGPCLIEGNIWWNPPNQHHVMGRVAERLESAITELSQENTPRAI